MRQQIDIHLTLDAPVTSNYFDLEDHLLTHDFGSEIELVEIKLYEEAEIVGTSPACEEYQTHIQLLKEALLKIANEPLWGEVKNVDIEAAKQAGEWEDESFAPSSETESSQLEYVVEIARFTLMNLGAK
ncbi:MAG: hypothetical protein JXR11_02635 [Balneola sp.]